MQGTANPRTSVRFRPGPPINEAAATAFAGVRSCDAGGALAATQGSRDYGVVVVVELVVVPPVELGATTVVVDVAFGPITCMPKYRNAKTPTATTKPPTINAKKLVLPPPELSDMGNLQ